MVWWRWVLAEVERRCPSGYAMRRLVASGTQLFASRGLHSVTTHSIARAAGVAAGTFYLHFKDKQALFREIALAAADDLRERLERSTRDARSLSG